MMATFLPCLLLRDVAILTIAVVFPLPKKPAIWITIIVILSPATFVPMAILSGCLYYSFAMCF
jgi:hypothetical protein